MRNHRTKTFALANFGQDPITQLWQWKWKMNSSFIGNPIYLAASVGYNNLISVISEIATTGSFDYAHPYGMALSTFNSAVRFGSQTAHGRILAV